MLEILCRRSIVFFSVVISFFVLTARVEAFNKPTYCGSGYSLIEGFRTQYPRDTCCESSHTVSSGTVTADGRCKSISDLTLSNTGAVGGYSGSSVVIYCRYTASIAVLRLKDDEDKVCNNSDGVFEVDGASHSPTCTSGQCGRRAANQRDYCYSHNERACNVVADSTCLDIVGRPNAYCCINSDASTCYSPPWCSDGCPAAPNPNPTTIPGGTPGTPDPAPPELLCSEKCSGEGEPGDQRVTDCNNCCTAQGIWTELGCLEATQSGIVIFVMRIFVGIVTALAVLRFIQAGLMLNTDDPEKIKEGKGIAVSAVMALIFGAMIPIILNFIGVDILGLEKIITFR